MLPSVKRTCPTLPGWRALARLVLLGLMLGAGCRPPDSPATPADLLNQGWSAYRLGEYKRALTTFDRLLAQSDLTPDLRVQALYGKAVTHDLRQPVPSQRDDLARERYEEILRDAPAHDLAAWSSLALARMTHLVPVGAEPDFQQVQAAYQKVIDAYPRHLAGQEALIYQQSTLVQSLDPALTTQAVARLQAFLAEQADGKFASAAYNLLAQAYETLDRPDDQLEARLKELETLEVDPASPAASDFSWRYWQLATTAEFLAGRLDIARMYYQKLIDEYPLDFRKFGSRQALQRMDELECTLRNEAAP
jgi:tetratricopeptide (TPR) repeat protein